MNRYEMHGASQEEQNRLKGFYKMEWDKATKNGKVTQLYNGFKDKLERYIVAEGDNNFRG